MNEIVYILLPVHNRREITERFIRCLREQTYRNYHLVLIDDGSTDGTADSVRKEIPFLSVITGGGGWWWAGSLQQGYLWLKSHRIASSDIVLIANDDTVFDSDFLEKGVALIRERPRIFLQALGYSQQNGKLIDAGAYVDWKSFSFETPSEIKMANCLSTRGLFLRVGDFFSVGGFHPLLLPHYASDYEFTIRARRKGMCLITDPSVKLIINETTTGYHQVDGKSFWQSLKTVFSRKSPISPITLFIFVALACPWPWKMNCWLRIAERSVIHGLSLLLRKSQNG